MRRLLALALLPIVLPAGGCLLGPNYEPPQLEAPASFPQPATTGAAIANLPWWEVYQDPALQELIRIAIAENQDLGIAIWRIEEARARYGVTRADQWNDFAVGLGVAWEVDLWGKLRRLTEAARAELLAEEENRRAITISLVAEVAREYLLLRDLDAQLDISQRTLASRQDSTRLIAERFKGGIVPELDLRQAEIEQADAAAAVSRFERLIAQSENALSFLLGRNPQAIPRGRALAEGQVPLEVPAGLPSELLERRPDVLTAAAQLHAQTARIGVAEALRWPTLGLTAAGGLESPDLSDLLTSNAAFWNIGANLFGPLFEFGKNKRRVEVERAITEQLLLNYEKTAHNAFREVADALAAIRFLREEVAIRNGQVESATVAARLSRARYDGGVTSYLEVLDSERSQFQAELQATEALRQQYAAIVDLYLALGGGWNPEDPQAMPRAEPVPEWMREPAEPASQDAPPGAGAN
ncbi:MAG: efflux transporter outer membrane subunit [Acidobacteria bacterium]|nr:efflux transporter outer membrane subunit [Acidobacteriota bacterium]